MRLRIAIDRVADVLTVLVAIAFIVPFFPTISQIALLILTAFCRWVSAEALPFIEIASLGIDSDSLEAVLGDVVEINGPERTTANAGKSDLVVYKADIFIHRIFDWLVRAIRRIF